MCIYINVYIQYIYIILYYTIYTIYILYTYDVTWHLEIHQPFFYLNATRTGFLRNMVGFVEELPATGPTGRFPAVKRGRDVPKAMGKYVKFMGKHVKFMGKHVKFMGTYGKMGATHGNSEECGYGKIREHSFLKMGKCWFQRCSRSCPNMGPKIWGWVYI